MFIYLQVVFFIFLLTTWPPICGTTTLEEANLSLFLPNLESPHKADSLQLLFNITDSCMWRHCASGRNVRQVYGAPPGRAAGQGGLLWSQEPRDAKLLRQLWEGIRLAHGYVPFLYPTIGFSLKRVGNCRGTWQYLSLKGISWTYLMEHQLGECYEDFQAARAASERGLAMAQSVLWSLSQTLHTLSMWNKHMVFLFSIILMWGNLK